MLWANGAEVGRGPVRSQPRRLRYDDYDLAPYLRVGVNTIAVLVTYYGTANSFWQPAVASGAMRRAALLVFEARFGNSDSSDAWLVSDGSWSVTRSAAWGSVPHGGLDHESRAVPTPHGLLHVSVEHAVVTIDSPVAVVFVNASGVETALTAGRHSTTL